MNLECGLLADELLDVCGHCALKNLAAAEMSLALCGLVAEVVAMIRVEHLNFARTGYGKSFGRRLVRFDLTHVYNPFK